MTRQPGDLADPAPAGSSVLLELGLSCTRTSDAVRGVVTIVPEMFTPGTDALRLSVLVTLADMIAGWQVLEQVRPRVPVTLELDVHVAEPVVGVETIRLTGRVAKAGRNVMVPVVDIADLAAAIPDEDDSDGGRLGVATGSFMVAPDPTVVLPADLNVGLPGPSSVRLKAPLAERLGLVQRSGGVVAIDKRPETTNASRSLNGGLLAVAAEEAVLSLAPSRPLVSMAVRYLSPVRVGPAVAQATVAGGLGRVELRDEGAGNRLAALVTTRSV